jgi:hypothetical protein
VESIYHLYSVDWALHYCPYGKIECITGMRFIFLCLERNWENVGRNVIIDVRDFQYLRHVGTYRKNIYLILTHNENYSFLAAINKSPYQN